MQITQKLIDKNFNKGRTSNIKWIAIHKQEGNGSLYGWFMNPSAKVSSHYWVSKSGTVEQYIEDDSTAWCTYGINGASIGIEHEGLANDVVTDAEYQSSMELVAMLCQKYNIPARYVNRDGIIAGQSGVVIHRDVPNNSTSCPANVDYMRIINGANSIINGTNMFDFKLDLNGKDTVLTIISGSCNADATVKNLNSGWVGTVRVNGGVGHTAVLNSDTGASLYEISLNGITHQLNNLPVVDYKTQLDILQGRFDTLYAESQAKDTQISSLNASVTDLNTKLGSSTKQVEDLLLKGNELDGQFSEYKTQSEADKKSLEESISLKETSLQAEIGNNQRLQEELRVCQAGSMGGQTSTVAEAFRKLLNWITNLFKKN